MKFNQLNGFVFDSESGVIGAVASVDFIKQTITILTDDDTQIVAKLANATFLEEVGAIGGTGVINHDVVQTTDGKLYEIVLVDENNVQLHLLDKKLERIEAGDIITKTDLHALAPYVTVIGNIHELEPEVAIDFNIIVVRKAVKGEIQFYYACNNAEKEEIDLIKVVFVGHHLLKEESYSRITVTHEEYLTLVEEGQYIETDPSALANYMTGLMLGKKQKPEFDEDEDLDLEDLDPEELEGGEEDKDTCEECGELLEDCDCGYDWQ